MIIKPFTAFVVFLHVTKFLRAFLDHVPAFSTTENLATLVLDLFWDHPFTFVKYPDLSLFFEFGALGLLLFEVVGFLKIKYSHFRLGI